MGDESLRVYVYSQDVLTESGLRAQLLESERVVMEQCPGMADIAVVAWPRADEDLSGRICQLRQSGCDRVLLVIADLDADSLPQIVDSKVSGVLRSSDASPTRLTEAAFAVATGGGCLPADMIAHILSSIHQPSHFRSVSQRLGEREEAVVRLLSEGYDTHQIAEELHFSERTIKGVVHQVIRRFGLRNRSHVVAYALRHGLI